MLSNKFCLWILILLGGFQLGYAQKKIQLRVLDVADSDFKFDKTINKSSEVNAELFKLKNNLISKGFLLCNFDSTSTKNDSVIVWLNKGQPFKWANLGISTNDQIFVASAVSLENYRSNKIFLPSALSKLMKSIVTYGENNGYPFISVGLDSVQIINSEITAKLQLNKGPLILLDSIGINGTANIKSYTLQRILNMKIGEPYDESNFKKCDQRLRSLPFVNLKKSSLILFEDSQNKKHKTKLNVFIDKNQAGQFDAIAGLLPNPNGRAVFTGDFKIKLVNALAYAEQMTFNFRRLQNLTQDALIGFTIPFVFKTSFGIDNQFKIYKRDSTFTDIQNKTSINYYFSALNALKLNYQVRSSSVIAVQGILNSNKIEDLADVNSQFYGLGFVFENLDYKFNPRKGFSININSNVGFRTIRKNSKLNDSYYLNIPLKSNQFQNEVDISYYIPIKKQATIKTRLQHYSVYSPTIYKNELYRIGGFRTLRGINEESIYANDAFIASVEYRYLFQENSALFLFTDAAYYENNTMRYINDKPIAVGAGINFQTKAGILSFSYALANQFNQGFDLRTVKLHFGLISKI